MLQGRRTAAGRRLDAPLPPLVDAYLQDNDRDGEGWEVSTYEKHRWALERLEKKFSSMPTTAEDFALLVEGAKRIRDGKPLRPHSKGTIWDVFRQFCSWCKANTDVEAPDLPYVYIPRGKARPS